MKEEIEKIEKLIKWLRDLKELVKASSKLVDFKNQSALEELVNILVEKIKNEVEKM